MSGREVARRLMAAAVSVAGRTTAAGPACPTAATFVGEIRGAQNLQSARGLTSIAAASWAARGVAVRSAAGAGPLLHVPPHAPPQGPIAWARRLASSAQPEVDNTGPMPASAAKEKEDLERTRSKEDCRLVIESLDDAEERLARKKLHEAPTLVRRAKSFAKAVGRLLSQTARLLRLAMEGVRTMSQYDGAQWRAQLSSWYSDVRSVLSHYWIGTKLLWTEVKIASKYIGKALNGKALSRRERTQLTRTTADIFRMVPMLIFLVVPFMEFLLPVALTIFPNMLPSTFQDELKREENLKRKLRLKLEMASFLQDTIDTMASEVKRKKTGKAAAKAADLKEFIRSIRNGETVTNDQIR